MEKCVYVFFGLLPSLCLCDSYKILTIFPLASTSHGILGDTMVKHLLDAGHEVTYITPFVERKTVHPNLHIVDVSANSRVFDQNSLDVKLIMEGAKDFQNKAALSQVMSDIAVATLSNPNVQKLMKDPQQKFDVIIGEYMFTYLYSTFPAVFQCPFIWFSTIEPHWMILNLIHGPSNPSYYSHYLHSRVAPYTFTERVYELWTQVYELYQTEIKLYYQEEQVYLEHIAPIIEEQGRPVPNYNELKYNASLLLGNSQVTVGSAIPLPPNYKHIGGFHIDDEVKPLPEDLKKIMDDAKNGVIYFSMGSNLKSKDLPTDLKRGLLEVFGGLKQTVIWKFEEKLSDTPTNVHLVHWAPQQSILAHPNLVLFVTHGGLLSITEAIQFAVPLIAIPVFADQFLNAVRAQDKGYAIKVDLSYNLHVDIKVALDEIIGNPKYATKVKELSIAYNDRPMKPKEVLNFWVQHVVRTRGAPHLRSIALQVPLYQRVYLDLMAVALLASIILILVVKRICCILSAKMSTKKKKH